MTRPLIAAMFLLALAQGLEASTPAPLEVADRFWRAYARGDIDGAMSGWDAQRAVRFRNVFEREHELHCLRVIDSSLRLSRQTPATAVVDVDALTVRTPASAELPPRLEEEHYAVSLRESAGEWKVTSWDRREELLADELARTPAAGHAAKLAEQPALKNGRLAIALNRVATLASNRQRLAEASALLQMGRRIAEEAGDDAALSAIVGAESVFQRKQSPPDEPASVKLGEEAERIALQSGDADAIARARMRLARALDYVDPPRAEHLLLGVLESADALTDTSTIAFAASQLAWIKGGKAEGSESFRYSLIASRYAELSGDPSARMNAAFNVAGAFAGIDLELASAYYEKAAAVARETNSIAGEAAALTMIAGIEWLSEPDGKASPAFARALELARCGGADADVLTIPLLALRTNKALRGNDLHSARADVSAALPMMYRSLLDPRLAGDLLTAEARLLLAEKRPREAIPVLEEARTLHGANPEWRGERSVSHLLAKAFRSLGRRGEAIEFLRQSISQTEAERARLPAQPQARELYFSFKTEIYHELIALLVESGKVDEALRVAEQATSRTLHDVLLADGPRRRRHSPAIELAEREVVRLNRTIVTATAGDPGIHRIRERLVQARLHLNDVITREALLSQEADSATHDAIDLQRIAEGTAILRYVVAEEQTIVLVARKSQRGPAVTAHVIPISRRDLDSRVRGVLAKVEARDLNYSSAATALHQLLVEPLLPDLAGVRRLSVVVDDPLWQLPFQTLLDRRGRHLVERFELSYAPSVSWCLRDQETARRPESILAIGDPELGGIGQAMVRALVPGSSLGRLPDAAREAREVGRLYPRSRVLTGSDAAESVLKDELARYDIVHLATHALIDEAQPRYSSIVLATPTGSQEDGLLEARELEFLDLDAQLVILSACNTARGQGIAGEGVVGLAWALLSRGVRHAVVSQWKADSKATTALMVAFHRHLTSGHSPAAALRKAQLDLRRAPRYEDPLYWAPFIVIGPS